MTTISHLTSFSRLRLLSVVLFALSSGCDSSGPRRDVTTARDSAGVKLTTTPTASLGARRFAFVDSIPLTLVGGQIQGRDEILFNGIKGAALIGDSSLVVLDAGSGQLRFFDGSGALKAATPGKGEGPGEVADASSLVLDSSAVVVWDGVRGNSVTFSVAGSYLGVKSANRDAIAAAFPELMQYPPAYRWTLLASSQLLLFVPPGSSAAPQSEIFRPQVTFVISPPNFSSRQILGEFGGLEQVRLPGGRGVLPAVNPKDTYYAASSSTGHVYVGDSGDFRIYRYSAAGRNDQIVSVNGWQRASTDAEIAEGRVALADWLRSFGVRNPDSLARLTRPAETAPAFRQLLVDDHDNLWIRLTRGSGPQGDQYAVFDSEGMFAGSVMLPPHERLLAVSGSRAALLTKTEDGVEGVAVHRLVRQNASR